MNKIRFKTRIFETIYFIVFGLFISMIPNMLNESCVLGLNTTTLISMLVMVIGFLVSYYLGDIENNNKKIKAFLKKEKSFH